MRRISDILLLRAGDFCILAGVIFTVFAWLTGCGVVVVWLVVSDKEGCGGSVNELGGPQAVFEVVHLMMWRMGNSVTHELVA